MSGLNQRFAKPSYTVKVYRGFESLPFRHFGIKPRMTISADFSPYRNYQPSAARCFSFRAACDTDALQTKQPILISAHHAVELAHGDCVDHEKNVLKKGTGQRKDRCLAIWLSPIKNRRSGVAPETPASIRSRNGRFFSNALLVRRPERCEPVRAVNCTPSAAVRPSAALPEPSVPPEPPPASPRR